MSTMQQALYVIMSGIPAIIIAYLAYRRSKKVDAVAEQSGVVTETRAGQAQIIEGLNAIIDQLQDDNKQWRDDFRYVTTRLDHMTQRLDVRDQENTELKHRLARMYRKFGENGNGIPNSGPIT